MYPSHREPMFDPGPRPFLLSQLHSKEDTPLFEERFRKPFFHTVRGKTLLLRREYLLLREAKCR